MEKMPPSPSKFPPLSPTTPKRRALHARSNSQTNEQVFPPTVRLIQDQDLQSETEIYSATPYPTKPQHVLLPPANQRQGSVFDAGYSVSHSTPNSISHSSSSVSHDQSLPSPDERDVSGQVSSIHGTHSSSQTWDDSLNSSKTSIPPSEPGTPRALRRGGREEDDNSSKSDGIPLPSTIICVPQDNPSSPPTNSPIESTYSDSVRGDDRSSPNLIPIGLTSSPNVVPINPSSPNLVPLGRSSPTLAPEPLTDSSLYEANSVGTARRYIRAGRRDSSQRNSTLTVDGSLSDPQSSTPSHSIPSSPPIAPLRSYQSTSSFGGLPSTTPYRIQPSTSSASSRSSRSGPDGHSPTGSSTPIQYPTIRYPSSSSRAEPSISRSYVRSMTERFSGRWNPHLSTVPSEWSAERSQSLATPSPRDHPPEDSWRRRLEDARIRDPSSPPTWQADQSEIQEQGDYLTHLRSPALRHQASGTLSHKSSLSALNNSRNLLRSPSGSSLLHVIPAWARVYYSTGAQFASLFSPDSRPSTPASPPMTAVSMFATYNDARMVSRTPLGITNPRIRPRGIEASPELVELDEPDEIEEPPPVAVTANPDPIDPRSHWVPDPEVDRVITQISAENLPGAWSPHLHMDKRARPALRSKWRPPSLDEAAEGLFGRRNAQVYAFVFGFVFPLAWIIAAFLPLPPQISHINEEATTSRPDLEHAFNSRVVLVDEVRHANARWWRNVNRFMSPLGLAIIVIVVTMAVLFS
ncbi:serine-rich protein [Histoplasma capsulatum var. duboisii H88]|uniref:Serine-rich protein n=1 Tax=Ajellomyces capsulatus (strain H88) TaxID=544711 RepID=A0A8A1LCI9_AJEC8|nr:serine-rich protein [Histoplasma capsulatum var. duboisii H88]